jgi:hypothetical protein
MGIKEKLDESFLGSAKKIVVDDPINYWSQKAKEAAPTVGKALETAKNIGKKALELDRKATGAVIGATKEAAPTVGKALETAKNIGKKALELDRKATGAVIGATKEVPPTVGKALETAKKIVVDDPINYWSQKAKEVVPVVGKVVADTGKKALEVAGNVGTGIKNLWTYDKYDPSLYDKTSYHVKNAAGEVVDRIKANPKTSAAAAAAIALGGLALARKLKKKKEKSKQNA